LTSASGGAGEAADLAGQVRDGSRSQGTPKRIVGPADGLGKRPVEVVGGSEPPGASSTSPDRVDAELDRDQHGGEVDLLGGAGEGGATPRSRTDAQEPGPP
jgi:hypothetical protein